MDLVIRQQLLLMTRALYFCQEEQWSLLGKKFELTPAQQHILFLLSTHDNTLTPTEISNLGCWHISTVTRLLKPLELKGYISISKDESRPRYKTISLTMEGNIALKKVAEHVKGLVDFPYKLSNVSEEEVLQFIEIGQRILDVYKGEEFKKEVLSAKMSGFNYAEMAK